MRSEEQWFDDDAGPVVRLYAVTSGRARPSGGQLDLVAVVAATHHEPDSYALSPEQRLLLQICRRPQTVADVASESELPVGVVRVLLGDLQNAGLVAVRRPHTPTQIVDQRVLQEVIDGLRAL